MMEWLNKLGFGMLSGGNPLQQAEQHGIGGGLPSNTQPKPQMPQPNRFLNDPAMSNALLRMGGAILTANSQGAGFGGSVGAGATAFSDGLQQGQESALRRAQIEAETAKAQREQQFGVRSSGFEGDIARAMVVLNNPQSNDEEKRVAQSIIQTAERMQGSYDPVSGDYRFNQRARLPIELTRPATADMMTAPAVQEAPLPAPQAAPAPMGAPQIMPEVQGMLAPPAATKAEMGPRSGEPMPIQSLMGGTTSPTAPQTAPRTISFTPTGNRKTDAELQAEQQKLLMAAQAEQLKNANAKNSDAPKAINRAVSALSKNDNIAKSIDEAKAMVKPYSAGLGSALAVIPGTSARDLDAKLKTIRANMGFQELQEMRDNSPTGGALGQVAVQEIEFLQSVWNSLDQGQSPEQLNNQLDALKDAVAASRARVRAAFEREYGSTGAVLPEEIAPQNDFTQMSDEELKRMLGL